MAWTYKKSRTPYELAFDDYDNFLRGLPLFADDHSADPDFYPHYALIPPLIDDYHAKYTAYNKAQEHEDKMNDKYHNEAITPLRDALVGLRRLLPALLDTEDILADFGIKQVIQTDVDKLIVQAEICRDHWAELCDPTMPPEYAPVQGKLDAIAGLITTLIDARHAYAEAIRDREIAQNALEVSREAINHEERRMFNWYRGLYTDPEHMMWEESPWGTSSGGEGGTGWKKAPVATMTKAPAPLDGILAGCEDYKGTDRFDLRIARAKKNEAAPDMPLVDTYTDVEQPVLLDADGFPLEKNFVYYLWIRARKDGEVSPWSEAASMEWEG